MKNKLILFDIDYTLFNVEEYRRIVFNKLQELHPEIENVSGVCMQAYDEMRAVGVFDPKVFTEYLLHHISSPIDPEILTRLWYEEDSFIPSLYPESEQILEKLAQDQNITLGLFSSGFEKLQLGKIQTLAHFFSKEHIHIEPMKDANLPRIVAQNTDKKIILVDDYIPVIEKAKQASSDIIAIWIKRGRLAEKVSPSKKYPPDYTITDLRQLLSLLDK